MKDRYLKVADVSAQVSLGVSTIYEKMARGEFPRPVKIGSKAVRWRQSDIDAFMGALQTQPASGLAAMKPIASIEDYLSSIGSGEHEDLIYGAPAIARVLNTTPREVYRLAEAHGLPAFRVGKSLCARRGKLAEWVRECEDRSAA